MNFRFSFELKSKVICHDLSTSHLLHFENIDVLAFSITNLYQRLFLENLYKGGNRYNLIKLNQFQLRIKPSFTLVCYVLFHIILMVETFCSEKWACLMSVNVIFKVFILYFYELSFNIHILIKPINVTICYLACK